ncbi:class I SAM-dependent methyltransferase [Streptomyces sp. S.PNR 29]|uniref:class I SAM-dependent methyltransferase n=1 Tax=Streptomyces sp. S.PNR 29 TaxID=2973805 RepID=UPI0025AEEC51|nr:class I SAM-dependent methyltransferase [Streptomyces sp. S.PNR 29]MDN0201116.1 class I SAM-dependent methyltransferase [Streptomyces sp. S.PNR 29]
MSFETYRASMASFPRFYPLIPDTPPFGPVMEIIQQGNEFDTDQHGRGDSYRVAQRAPDIRLHGIQTLLELALAGPIPQEWPDDLRILDVLGGDGTLARALARLRPYAARHRQCIMTSDLSRHMVLEALNYGLPAICQPAQHLLLPDASFDAVILAYGTHHIPAAERRQAYAEALRVLKPNGRIVVHDFEENGAVAQWFSTVVHRYSPNGHAYQHFTREELLDDLRAVGFREATVRDMYDPFRVTGPTAEAARSGLCAYVAGMYGLFKLRRAPDWQPRLWELIGEHAARLRGHEDSGMPLVRRADAGFVAVMPRRALVGVGVR